MLTIQLPRIAYILLHRISQTQIVKRIRLDEISITWELNRILLVISSYFWDLSSLNFLI